MERNEDIQEAMEVLKKQKDRTIEYLDYVDFYINRVEDDILIDKDQTERRLIDGIRYPEIEELYELKRVNQLKYLNQVDEDRAKFKKKREEVLERYDENMKELQKKMDSRENKEKKGKKGND